tara:strand:+ start:101 stop:364 length:264 start_codon:yes stop_codon:yes gene_type:complete
MIKTKKEIEKKNNIMKKIIIITLFIFTTNLNAEENCKDLPGFKKIGKDSIQYMKCIANKSKIIGSEGIKKLNTDSKLTDWIKKKLNK